MKYLYLLRHGKSLWKNYDGNDHERDISKKGIEKTKNVAQKFLLKNLFYKIILINLILNNINYLNNLMFYYKFITTLLQFL